MKTVLSNRRLKAIGISALLGAAAGMVLLAGSFSHATAAEEHDGPVTVKMTIMKFVPERVTINAGETVRWDNTSVVPHTVTAVHKLAKRSKDVELPKGAEQFNSGNLAAHKVYEHKFTVPGTYRYFCIQHEMLGMEGEVIVKPAK